MRKTAAIVAMFVAVSSPALAQTPLTPETFGLSPVAVAAFESPAAAQFAPAEPGVAERLAHGFMSFGYSFNAGQPSTRSNQLRVFDFDDRRLKLDVAELVLQHTPAKPGSFGFRSDLVAGTSVPGISAASGLFRDAATGIVNPANLDLQQAYVSYLAPLGSGLRVDAGKFTTHVGAEVIEGADGYNDTYTRGYLFGFAEPFTHTGVRASYAFSPMVSAMVLVVNGWDNALDNNGSKSVGAQIALTPSKTLTVFTNYLGGAERADSGDLRHLIDVVAVSKPRDEVTVTVSYDYGHEKNGAGPGANASWQGVSASVKADLTPRYSLAARAELFADPSGARTGTAQRLAEATVTPWVKLSRHVIVRADVRLDRSNAGVFETAAGAASHHQMTAALNALLVF